MVKISKKKLNSDKRKQLADQLWRSIVLLKTKKEVRDFLFDILTRTETQMISKRLEVVKMLDEGYSYEAIKTELSVTDSTIATAHNWYEEFGNGYKMVIDRLHKVELKENNGRPLVNRKVIKKGQKG